MYERRGWLLVAGEQLAHTDPPVTEVLYELELPDNEEGPAGGEPVLRIEGVNAWGDTLYLDNTQRR